MEVQTGYQIVNLIGSLFGSTIIVGFKGRGKKDKFIQFVVSFVIGLSFTKKFIDRLGWDANNISDVLSASVICSVIGFVSIKAFLSIDWKNKMNAYANKKLGISDEGENAKGEK